MKFYVEVGEENVCDHMWAHFSIKIIYEHVRFGIAATARAVGHLQKSTEVMKLVNNLMKAPEMASTMQELSKEMMKVCTHEDSTLSL